MKRHALLLFGLILLGFVQHAGAQQTIVAESRSIDWANVGMGSGLGIVASLFAAGALVITRRHRRPGPA